MMWRKGLPSGLECIYSRGKLPSLGIGQRKGQFSNGQVSAGRLCFTINTESTVVGANGIDSPSTDICTCLFLAHPCPMKPRRRRRTWAALHQRTRPSFVHLFLATFYALTLLASPHQHGAIYDDPLLLGILPNSPVPVQQRDPSHQLIARQSNESTSLPANAIVSKDISPETTDFWTLSLGQLNVSGSATVYITVSTCTQPFPKPGLNATQIYLNETLPPLQIYVSTDAANSRPGPASNPPIQPQDLKMGYASVNISGVTNDVFLAVVTGNISSKWQGSWSYQIGASTQGNRHLFNEG